MGKSNRARIRELEEKIEAVEAKLGIAKEKILDEKVAEAVDEVIAEVEIAEIVEAKDLPTIKEEFKGVV